LIALEENECFLMFDLSLGGSTSSAPTPKASSASTTRTPLNARPTANLKAPHPQTHMLPPKHHLTHMAVVNPDKLVDDSTIINYIINYLY
jgi:hypothetical protein